ncbi:MAG: Lrp/AsnC family transcriptional regulator [Thermoplasmata archaeon]|nr:Lrp/AsnC family transcriptional regulator [Thermoplasmata archaeon]
MDKLDYSIINLLNENARKSYRQMAKELDVSMSTISNRIRKMEEEEIIKGYIPLIDPQKVGYDLLAVIGMRISHGKMIKVQDKISKTPEVISVYDITGEWDSIIVVRFRNRRELNKFIKWITSMEFVERTYTQIVLNVVKEEVKVPVPG